MFGVTPAEAFEVSAAAGAEGAGAGSTAGFDDTTGWLTGGAACPPRKLCPAYRSAPTSTTAATPTSIFFLPPLASGTLAPPKVNVGAGMLAEDSLGSAVAEGALLLRASFSVIEGIAASMAAGDCASRAGAAALAAPPPNDAEGDPDAAGADTVGARGAAGLGKGLASTETAGIECAGAARGAVGRICGVGGAIAATFLAAGGAIVGTGDDVGTGASALTEVAGFATGAALGLAAMVGVGVGAGFAGGAAGRCVGGVGVVATGAAGFAASPFLSSPRATRRVPLACSTLMGLVRTRLAPIRKAFATPA